MEWLLAYVCFFTVPFIMLCVSILISLGISFRSRRKKRTFADMDEAFRFHGMGAMNVQPVSAIMAGVLLIVAGSIYISLGLLLSIDAAAHDETGAAVMLFSPGPIFMVLGGLLAHYGGTRAREVRRLLWERGPWRPIFEKLGPRITTEDQLRTLEVLRVVGISAGWMCGIGVMLAGLTIVASLGVIFLIENSSWEPVLSTMPFFLASTSLALIIATRVIVVRPLMEESFWRRSLEGR